MAEPAEKWARSVDEWRARVNHDVTLPSGMRVTVRIPGLATLASHDALPDDLTEIAVLHVANPQGAAGTIAEAHAAGDNDRVAQLIESLAQLTKWLVAWALVEPTVSVEQLDDLPTPDLELLMRIVTRRTAYDARGVRIGIEPLDDHATFRDEHRCPTDCEACARAQQALSAVHLGAV